jgi:hypothetical protein
MTLIRDSVEIMALLLSRQQLIGMRNNWPEPYETQRETAVNWRLGAAFHGEPVAHSGQRKPHGGFNRPAGDNLGREYPGASAQ